MPLDAIKRYKNDANAMCESPQREGTGSASSFPSASSSSSSFASNVEMSGSPFVPTSSAADFAEHTLDRRRKSPRTTAKTQSVLSSSTANERVYTEKQVKKLMEEAVREREEQLRDEFSKTLNDLLSEQFHSFNKFNQDYVSRLFRGSEESSYIS